MYPLRFYCLLSLGIAVSITAHNDDCGKVNEYLLRAACKSNSNGGSHVHFSVSRKRDTTLSAHNQKIIFDDVLVNRGNAYDKSTGVFHCPRRGDYKFSFTILKTISAKSHIFLMVNNNRQLVTYTPGRHDRETLNGDIILSLQRGDIVYLQGQEKGMGIHGRRYSMLSGMSL